MTATLPFIGYGRISRLNGRDAADNVSRTEQLAHVRRIAAQHSLPLLPEEFFDVDASGSTFDRADWERAIRLIREGAAGGVVAFDLKRISRGKTGEVLAMIEDVESVGGRLYDGTGRVSVGDADAELMATVKAMIARREWRERREYLLASVRNAIGRGVHLGVPFGYRRSAGTGSTLAVDPVEAAQVARMFTMRADGSTWPAIAKACNASGPAPRPHTRDGEAGQAAWSAKGVRKIVQNRVYVGTAWNGEHETEHAHEAIVDEGTFARANRTRGTKPLGPRDGYLLTGLVRCNSCGYAMTYKNGSRGLYVRCQSRLAGRTCATPASVPALDLEAFVVQRFTADYLTGANESVAGTEVAEAADRLEVAKRRLVVAYRARRELPEDASETEREVALADLEEARGIVAAAEHDLMVARMGERSADLPPELDADYFAEQAMPEQRHLLSLVYAAVVVRASARYREPAAERALLLEVGRPRLVGAALRREVMKLPV